MLSSLDDILGLIYVASWSISMYTPVVMNWKHRSAGAVSVDFVMLNTAGYLYLTLSMYLQLCHWNAAISEEGGVSVANDVLKPKVTDFDLFYTVHGFVLNLILMSQIYLPSTWKFKSEKLARMKPLYYKLTISSLSIFIILLVQFTYENSNLGWDNGRTLSFCNKLFVLKLVMSLIKYIPQVKHNYDRKTLKGFSINGVMLDCLGGVASLLQLLLQLYQDHKFGFMVFVANFGKIGLGLFTLLFDCIFLSQYNLYGAK